eukprot:tig00021717_g23143.t1
MRSGQSTPSDLSSAASLAVRPQPAAQALSGLTRRPAQDGESGSCSGTTRARGRARRASSRLRLHRRRPRRPRLRPEARPPRAARPPAPSRLMRAPDGAAPARTTSPGFRPRRRAGSSRGAPRGPRRCSCGPRRTPRRAASPPASHRPPSPLLTARPAAAQLCGAFRRLAEPAALLASRAAVCDLVALLLDPRLLASSVYATLEGRCASAAPSPPSAPPAPPRHLSAAYADPANATLMLDRCHGLLLAGTSELVDFGEAVAGTWRGRDRVLHCRALHRRALALFHLLRIQHTPSRLEAAVLRDLVEMHLEAGRGGEAGRGLAERLYYFPGEVGGAPRTPSTPPTFSASSVRPAPPHPARPLPRLTVALAHPARRSRRRGAGAELGHGRACGKRRRLEHGIC